MCARGVVDTPAKEGGPIDFAAHGAVSRQTAEEGPVERRGQRCHSRIILEDAGGARKVRFCWAVALTCNLYDGKSGLPVVPFDQEVKR